MLKTKLLFFFIILFSGTIFSQNYNDVLRLAVPGLGSSARSLGMGNAFNALSDDASAAYFNPAGLGLLKRLEFSGGIDYYNYNNNAEFLNTNMEYSNNQTQLNRISFAFPFPTMRGSLVFGISFNRSKNLVTALRFDAFNSGNTSKIQDMITYSDIPYQLYLADENNNTNINGNLNQSGTNVSSGSIGNWTFTGAVEAAKNFFIGGSFNFITGTYDFSSDYFEDDTRNFYQGLTDPTEPATVDFQTFNIRNIIDWELSGWDGKIGFLYQLDNIARFGGTVQFPKVYTVEEKYNVSAYSQFADFSQNYDYSDAVEYDITTPYNFTGAIALNYAGFIFSAEATIIDYSQSEFEADPNGIFDYNYITDVNLEIKELLRTVVNYNLGLEYTIPKVGLRLRGGFLTQPSAFKDDPTDFDRKFVTGGLGYLADDTFGIDFGYAYGWWNDIGDNYGSGESRTFQDITVNNFVFTFTYRF